MRTHGAVVGRRFRSVTKLTTKVRISRGYLWGSFLIAAAALKTPTRNGYNAQGVNLKFRHLFYCTPRPVIFGNQHCAIYGVLPALCFFNQHIRSVMSISYKGQSITVVLVCVCSVWVPCVALPSGGENSVGPSPLCGSPVWVTCAGPLCGSPVWVPSVWVPCVGPLCGFARRAASMWHLLA